MKFVVKEGQHFDGTKVYVKGEVVESNKDLTKIFTNKFVRVGHHGQPEVPVSAFAKAKAAAAQQPTQGTGSVPKGVSEWASEDEEKENKDATFDKVIETEKKQARGEKEAADEKNAGENEDGTESESKTRGRARAQSEDEDKDKSSRSHGRSGRR